MRFDIRICIFPATRVSGDFYDAFMLPGGYCGLVIGDVCDKGIGSALFMALYRSLIRIFSGQAQLSRTRVDRQSQTVGGAPGVSDARSMNEERFSRRRLISFLSQPVKQAGIEPSTY